MAKYFSRHSAMSWFSPPEVRQNHVDQDCSCLMALLQNGQLKKQYLHGNWRPCPLLRRNTDLEENIVLKMLDEVIFATTFKDGPHYD